MARYRRGAAPTRRRRCAGTPCRSSSAATAMHMKQRLLRQAMLVRPPERSSAYLRTAVPVIHGLLHTAKQDVPYYVFGHTHIAERIPLVSTAATPCYLNSGT